LKPYALTKLFSWRELVVFVLLFLLLMVAFFPAGKLEKYLEKDEGTNAELTRKYTEALMRVKSPAQIKKAILSRYAYGGEREKVLELIEEIRKENPKEADELEYQFLKGEFFRTKGKEREKIRRRMRVLLKRLLYYAQSPQELAFVYKESREMNFPELAFESAYRLAKLTGEDRWKERAFLLAYALGKKKAVEELAGTFRPTKRETFKALYYYYLSKGNWDKALAYLEKSGEGKEEMRILLEFLAGRSGEAKFRLLELAKREPEKAKKVFLEALRTLASSGKYGEMKELIREVAPLLGGGEDFYKELLKMALATGDPYFASWVAEEVAKKTGVLP